MRTLAALRRETTGAVAIETAIVTPVLLLMSLGAFEASMIFGRQMDIQNAAAEAAQIALAAAPTDEVAQNTVRDVIKASLGFPDEDLTSVVLREQYRCETEAEYVDTSTECTGHYARFIEIRIKDDYTPSWSQISGIGKIDYDVVRMVQVG